MNALNAVGKWAVNVLACFSQLLNVALLNGHPNETLSARCGRMVKVKKTKNPFWILLAAGIDLVFMPIEPDHCFESYITERVWARAYVEDAP